MGRVGVLVNSELNSWCSVALSSEYWDYSHELPGLVDPLLYRPMNIAFQDMHAFPGDNLT